MIRFDLEKALAGEKVITRDGREVTQITRFKGVIDNCESIYALLDGEVISFYDTGDYSDGYSSKDLFMAPKKLSGFINVNVDKLTGEITIKLDTTGIVGSKTTARIDLSQFEEGHGL
jgi:hypothetical protein